MGVIMKKIVTFLAYCILTVLIVILVTGGAGLACLTYLAMTRLPDHDRAVFHPSLRGKVTVARDDFGTPHIQATCETDAYFALGYVMGQDRLFQMEALRRLARGELAEVLGSPAVSIDRLVRLFRLRAKAEAYFVEYGHKHPEMMQASEAFVAGINHAMDTEPLPFEFAVLGIPKRPFTLIDCLSIGALLPITFADGLRQDPLYNLMQERLPDIDVQALFPGYSRETPITIMESIEEAAAYLAGQDSQNPQEPSPEENLARRAATARSEALTLWLEMLQPFSDRFGPALGSNSWVLGPSRTKSGKPILANDPHIGFTNPGVWYEAHLAYPPYDNYGHYFPLIPFPLLGHNLVRGWGLTMFANDDIDLYFEQFHPDDPMQVMFKGEWTPVKTETEVIQVRFGQEVRHDVRITPHGPVITDLLRLLHDYEGPDVSLSWTWQNVEYTDMLAFYRMGLARDLSEFREAVAFITSPGINISYADAQGNIAWWAAGKITIRPEHVYHKKILDGASGLDEILGYVPFDLNPHLINPESGYIVTANNKPTVKPVGPMKDLQGYWQPGDRAARIEEILETRNDWTIDALRAVQFDDTAWGAPIIIEPVLRILRYAGRELEAREVPVLNELAAWDYRHNTSSIGACIYQVLCDAILRHALLDEMGPIIFRAYTSVADHWNFLKYFIQDEDSPFWDDITTPGRETRDEIVLAAFKETCNVLYENWGNRESWAWGHLHTMEFKHPFGYLPLLGRIFNVGPFPASGGSQVVNNMLYTRGAYNFDVIAGPSTRRLIDFASPAHSLTVLPTGNSGHFRSPHYGDQADLFMAGEYREPRITPQQILNHTRHTMTFTPGS